MNLRRGLDWRLWPDLASEALLRLGGPLKRPRTSLWPVPADVAERVSVQWPEACAGPNIDTGQIRDVSLG